MPAKAARPSGSFGPAFLTPLWTLPRLALVATLSCARLMRRSGAIFAHLLSGFGRFLSEQWALRAVLAHLRESLWLSPKDGGSPSAPKTGVEWSPEAEKSKESSLSHSNLLKKGPLTCNCRHGTEASTWVSRPSAHRTATSTPVSSVWRPPGGGGWCLNYRLCEHSLRSIEVRSRR